jgi:hypothetical protein
MHHRIVDYPPTEMRNVLLTFVLFSCIVGTACSRKSRNESQPVYNQPIGTNTTQPSQAQPHAKGPTTGLAQYQEVILDLPGLAWMFLIWPDGSARIEYGSTAGDDASLPKGTLDFAAIVVEVLRQKTTKITYDYTEAALLPKGSNECQTVLLRNDAYFRELIKSLDDKWQDKGWRFDELRKKYPFYPPPTAGNL